MSDKTVLIVDDEASIREMIAIALEMAGYHYIEAADAKTAHGLIVDQRPDLIILDWMLPGTSGIDLARRLKRDDGTNEIPIIMLTAKTEEDNRVQGLEAGADDYISKPFDPELLKEKINNLLVNRKELQEAYSQKVKVEGSQVEITSTEHQMIKNEFKESWLTKLWRWLYEHKKVY